jgi:hypothetical protein
MKHLGNESIKVLEILPEKAGFFAIFLQVLGNCEWCERNGYIPWVNFSDERCLYWSKDAHRGSINAWEYYFEPVSDYNLDSIKPEDLDIVSWAWYPHLDGGDGIGIYEGNSNWNDNPPLFYRKYVHELIIKYIKVKNYITEQVEDFFEARMKGNKVIGVHVRRTDSVADSFKRSPPLEEYVREVNHYIQFMKVRSHEEVIKIFLATDDAAILEKFRQIFSERLIYCPFTRSSNGEALHLNPEVNKPRAGEEVLVESLLLSRCDFLVHSRSNVSTSALYFNPDLDNIYITPRPPLPRLVKRIYRYLNSVLKIRLN